MRVFVSLGLLRDDLRYGCRVMRRNRVFTAAALASLTLGIGATTAIFSLVDTLIVRPLPVRNPHELVEMLWHYPGDPPMNGVSWRYYEHYRDANRVFSDFLAMSPVRLAVTREGRDAGTVDAAYVVGGFFPGLGVRAALGRSIEPRDDVIGSAGAAVVAVSWLYWRTQLGGDPAIVGRSLVVGGVPATVIGVLAPDFTGLQVGLRTDVWMPVAMEPLIQRPSARASGDLGVALIARLKPGVSRAQAGAEMRTLDRVRVEEIAARSGDPVWRQVRMDVVSAASGFSMLRARFAGPLLAVLGTVGVLLLLVCANVAGLLLARGLARRGEMAVRVSLGAGRLHLVRQLLAETAMLSAAGCVLGLVVAYLGADALARIIASDRMIRVDHLDIPVRVDVRLLTFAAAISVVTCLLAGLLPAWQAFTARAAATLREMNAVGDTPRRRHIGRGLVIADVALALVMMSGALLVARHVSDLRDVGTGFARDSVLLVTLEPRGSGYDLEQLTRRYRDLLGRLETLPGVRSVALSAVTPIQGGAASRFVSVDGLQEPAEDRRRVMLNWVGPNYFSTLRTPWRRGRDFRFDDDPRRRVAIVNEAMVDRHFAGLSPLGRYVRLENDDRAYEVVGVVGNAKYMTLHESPPPTMYLNAFQDTGIASQFVVRTERNPYLLTEAVRSAVAGTLPAVRVGTVTTLAEQVDATIVPERLMSMLSALFGALGALLAAIGVYGLMAYMVAGRLGEIAMRMALGATRAAVVRIVLREAMLVATAGIVVGLPLVVLAARLAVHFVDGLASTAGGPGGAAAALMLAIAAAAALLPAWQAARVQPLEVLRGR